MEQAAVLERHRGVGGEGGGDGQVLGGEALCAAGEEGEHADHPVAHPRGHREHPMVAQAAHRLGVVGDHARVAGRIAHQHRPAGGRDLAGHALAELQTGAHRHLGAALQRARDHQLVAVHQPEADPVRLHEAPARLRDPAQQRVERLHARQLAADLDQALETGLAGARLVKGLLEARGHRVERAHGGPHLGQPRLGHPRGEIAVAEPRGALGERAHRPQPDEQDHVGEAQQGDEQDAGHRDHGADLGPQLALEALHRGRDRQHPVDHRRGRDGHAMLGQGDGRQPLEPARGLRAGDVGGGGVEDDAAAVALVEHHPAPHGFHVQVAEGLLGAREVADDQRVEQQRGGRGGEPLGLLREAYPGGGGALAEVDREAPEGDGDDRDGAEAEEERAEAGFHWPMSR